MKEITATTYGASLSIKACRQFEADLGDVLQFALKELGLRRFRLMTYWDECESVRGQYDFSAVQQSIDEITRWGGEVTLSLGLRQPRWPECHPPQWVAELNEIERERRLLAFIETTVETLQGNEAIKSYQLENEALNRGIGTCDNYSRPRFKREHELVKRSDPERPIIMSTSDSWGMPWRKPRPDVYAFSMYRHQWTRRSLSRRYRSPLFMRARKQAIEHFLRRPVICHELQMEPWGPKSTERLTGEQQYGLMSPGHMEAALHYAAASGFTTVDMWGLEWWYWRAKGYNDTLPAEVVRKVLAT